MLLSLRMDLVQRSYAHLPPPPASDLAGGECR